MELARLEKLEEQLERSLEIVREQRRELINRKNLNKENEQFTKK